MNVMGFRFFLLEHFELCRRRFRLGSSFSIINFHASELFVSELKNANLSIGWNDTANALKVYGGVFLAGAVTIINGKLHHHKTIFNELFAEDGIFFSRPGGVGRQVKAHN